MPVGGSDSQLLVTNLPMLVNKPVNPMFSLLAQVVLLEQVDLAEQMAPAAAVAVQ